jgi:hypothetical protein
MAEQDGQTSAVTEAEAVCPSPSRWYSRKNDQSDASMTNDRVEALLKELCHSPFSRLSCPLFMVRTLQGRRVNGSACVTKH